MRWWLPLALLMLGACSKGPQADLPYIGEARSLAGEWAMVNDQAAKGQLNATYAETMRAKLREQLQTASSSLTQLNSPYGAEIQLLLREPGDVPPQALKTHSDKLKQIEDQLESA
ncbi:MAG TPA: hypothetical protein VJT70_06450 [Sphingomicrobium sp.]|nr:hypothetical protein [Sphingomicrobium sp.]